MSWSNSGQACHHMLLPPHPLQAIRHTAIPLTPSMLHASARAPFSSARRGKRWLHACDLCAFGGNTQTLTCTICCLLWQPRSSVSISEWEKKGNLTGVGMRPLLYSNGTIHHSAFYLPKNWLLQHFCRSLIGNKNTATRQVFKQEGVKWHLGAGMAENLVFKLHIWRAKHLHEWPSTCFFFSSFSSLPNAKHRLVNYRVTKPYFLPWTGPSFLSL